MNLIPVASARPAPIFEFEDLAGLPCGCVTAAFRAIQWGVTLVSVEAKGPHCVHTHHFQGQVLQLGEPPDAGDADDDDDDVEVLVGGLSI